MVLNRTRLVTDLGCSKRSLQRYLSALEKAGVIERQKKDGSEEVIRLVKLKEVKLDQLRNFSPQDGLVSQEPMNEGRGARVLVSAAIMEDSRLTGTERRVLAFYLAVANKKTGQSWWSHQAVAQLLSIHEDTLRHCRARLEKLGYIRSFLMRNGRPATQVLAQKGRDEEQDLGPPTEQTVILDNTSHPSINHTLEPDTQTRMCPCGNSPLPQQLQTLPVPKQDIVSPEAVAIVMNAVVNAVGDVYDPHAHQVKQLIARRLSRGQTAALLVTAFTAYANRAHYRIPASALLRSNAIDKWSIPVKNPHRKPVSLSSNELAFEREIRVGAHDPAPSKTPEQQASENELVLQWLALPLDLPTCSLSLEQQDKTITEILKATRRNKDDNNAFEWLASEVWSRHLGFAHFMAWCAPEIPASHQELKEFEVLKARFEQALRRMRRDVTFETFCSLAPSPILL